MRHKNCNAKDNVASNKRKKILFMSTNRHLCRENEKNRRYCCEDFKKSNSFLFFSYCILLTLIAIEKKKKRNCSSFISSNATTYCYILNTKESSSSIQEYSGRIRNIPNEDQYCTELTRIYLSDEKEKRRIHICTVKAKGCVHRHVVNSSAWLLIYEKMSC